jgi:ribonuclease D
MSADAPSQSGPRRRRRTRAARHVEFPPAADRPAGTDAVEDPDDTGLNGTPLIEPAGGVPPVIETEDALAELVAGLRGAAGPIAIDAERASGYRYGQRAYLVQINRRGYRTALLDPIAFTDLTGVAEALSGSEWVIHAATQDLPCLAELGLRPTALFDTELGARLAGQPRVGLGAVVEHYLGFVLAKEHSAADWSTRPLPEPWLRYAALDVDVLLDLRDALEADLDSQGKLQWAREEFSALVGFVGPAPRTDPWRRTSGMHRLRKPRDLAVVREVWQARDEIAAERDISPGRVLPDAVIVALAQAENLTEETITATRELRAARRYAAVWVAAVRRARALAAAELPPASLPSGSPPPPRAWADRDPAAAKRLALVRAGLAALSEEHRIPQENLLAPDLMRRVLWSAPADDSTPVDALAAGGARPWQIALAGPLVTQAYAEHSSA